MHIDRLNSLSKLKSIFLKIKNALKRFLFYIFILYFYFIYFVHSYYTCSFILRAFAIPSEN